jgi:hypothetical protein
VAVVWIGTSQLQRNRVDITWVAGPTCTGSEVSTVRIEDGDRVPSIAMREAMDCRRTVRVTNDGWFGVTLDLVTLPMMGPGAADGVQVPTLEGRASRSASDAVDATFDLGRSIKAGSSEEFEIEFRFRPDGCDSDGGAMWLRGLPRIKVSVLGLSGNRANPEYTAFRGTAESSCDS